MNERINVKEITECAKKPPFGACPADIAASIRVRELAEAIVRYADAGEHTQRDIDRCIVFAEEIMDQLSLMKKYGIQDVKWPAGGRR